MSLQSSASSFPRSNQSIQRLVGEAIQERLVAPEWSKNKQRILNGFQCHMESKDTKQVAKYAPVRSDTIASVFITQLLEKTIVQVMVFT